jgi:tRNA pseudouridine55 synthase
LTTASGLLLVDKPEGFTSHDVVAKLRGIVGTRKIGHAGTLDPMATGLLVIGVNSATKLLTFLVGEDKTYIATIRLGASTITDDRESEYLSVASSGDVDALTELDITNAIRPLTGQIMQVPSSVSAIKVDGERAYAKVRGGDEVKLAARPVTIARFDVLGEMRRETVGEQHFIDLDVIIDCSSGTYIRALARDLGVALEVGGHLTALRRTRVGAYQVTESQALADLKKGEVELLPIADAAREAFDVRELSADEVVDLRHGKRIEVGVIAENATAKDRVIAAFAPTGELIAILTKAGSTLKSLVVFAEVPNG